MVKQIIIGTDLVDEIKKYDVILIGSTIKNSKGNGFQYKIGRNFPEIYKTNRRTNYDDKSKLGTCQVITKYKNEGYPIFVLCYITPFVRNKKETLDYKALADCFELINEHFKGKNVASTVMGSSVFEGNGNTEKIYEIIDLNAPDINLYLYDYQQKDYKYEDNENYFEIFDAYKNKEFDLEELRKRKSHFLWEKAFGKYLIPYPEGMDFREVKKKIKELKKQEDILA